MKKVLLGLVLCLLSFSVFAKDFEYVYLGSGFFINEDGYIATAAHVVKDNKYLEVYYNGVIYKAQVVTYNPKKDVSIIKISADTHTPYLTVATSAVVGEETAVVGYPIPDVLGYTIKMFVGYLESTTSVFSDNLTLKSLSCAGDSGGAVLNAYHAVVGILVAGYPTKGFQNGECSFLSIAVPASTLVQEAVLGGVKIYINNGRTGNTSFSQQYKQLINSHVMVLIVNHPKQGK